MSGTRRHTSLLRARGGCTALRCTSCTPACGRSLIYARKRSFTFPQRTASVSIGARFFTPATVQVDFPTDSWNHTPPGFPKRSSPTTAILVGGAAEPAELLLPSLASFTIETVQPDFVYYVEYSLVGRRSRRVRTYITDRDGRMLLLDTWDYEEVLVSGNDGLCYYIQ